MKSIELRRHAEKDPNGLLTENGIEASKKLSKTLHKFSKVFSSDSDRAKLTAKLLTGIDAQVDARANMWMASTEKSAAINDLATKQGIMFLEAISRYDDPEVIEGTNSRADEFNTLIDKLFSELDEDEHGLVVSHDLSISAAMAKRGTPIEMIAPLAGYTIYEDGSVKSASA
ncbi:histidine phosphatase family protein [Streptomyces caniscabiei]|uniref:histidine phosphatase family protein n=1 Tax=Streptomyces caniscabiei TaxID=2746961 RepID=UPI0029A87D78|nr:histidine phosphatase family protein [Streptomyces caniscabiei]MDX2776618.1 histidine phosphatase family protein [Streptomyces caniscabiei]